jgi:hypothetical protein
MTATEKEVKQPPEFYDSALLWCWHNGSRDARDVTDDNPIESWYYAHESDDSCDEELEIDGVIYGADVLDNHPVVQTLEKASRLSWASMSVPRWSVWVKHLNGPQSAAVSWVESAEEAGRALSRWSKRVGADRVEIREPRKPSP